MLKRLFDICASAFALLVFGPVIVVGAVAVKLSSKGPAFYCPQRAGIDGVPFTLFKLRTMHIDHGSNNSVITAATDSRVFRVGNILRKLKIDELPQLWNILRGDMSVVGPRPEDLKMVEQHYDEIGMLTLTVRPGLSGVGSIYYYTHGEKMLTGDDPEEVYARDLLPIKLALEVVHLRKDSLVADISVIVRTIVAIAKIAAGTRQFDDPPELPEAKKMLPPAAQSSPMPQAA